MENLMKNFKTYSVYLGIFILALGTSCSDDDDGDVIIPPDETEITITAEDQVISQNTLTVTEVEMEDAGWLVVRKVNDDGTHSDLIAQPVALTAGTNSNLSIQLRNTTAGDVDLQSGDSLILQLHKDDGDGVFEYEDGSGEDIVIEDSLGNEINETIVITAPNFTWEDQAVVDNGVTFSNVSTQSNGWIVLHDQNEDGTMSDEIVGWAYVAAGSNDDVVVTFDDDFTYVPGQTLYSMVHLDDPDDEKFTFGTDPTEDMPEIFGFGEDGSISGSITID